MKTLLSVLLLAAAGGAAFYFYSESGSDFEISEQLPESIREMATLDSTVIETFEIDASSDVSLESNSGAIIVAEAGSFVDSKGNVVSGNIELNVVSATSPSDMIALGLSSPEGMGEMHGMMYIQPMKDGKPLEINPEKPLFLSVPTEEKDSETKVLSGAVNEEGEIDWTVEKEPDNYLINLPFEDLDFYPNGFEDTLRNNLPFRGHTSVTPELLDSVFTALSIHDASRLRTDFVQTSLNEPFQNNWRVIRGKYTDDSYLTVPDRFTYKFWQHNEYFNIDQLGRISITSEVDPALIKAIQSEQFDSTYIATREFENRLKVLYATCRNEPIEIYLANLHRDMYEADSTILHMLKSKSLVLMSCKSASSEILSDTIPFETDNALYESLINVYSEFVNQRVGNTRGAPKSAELLEAFTKKRLSEIKAELEAMRSEYETVTLNPELANAKKVTEAYKKLLLQRETYRMEAYRAKWTKTGWVGFAIGKMVGRVQTIEVEVTNATEYDRVHTYVIIRDINTLNRLNRIGSNNFITGSAPYFGLLMLFDTPATLVSVGYADKTYAIGIKEFITANNSSQSHQISLTSVSKESFDAQLKSVDPRRKENSIRKDLEFQAKLNEINESQRRRMRDEYTMMLLNLTIHPCDLSCYSYMMKGSHRVTGLPTP